MHLFHKIVPVTYGIMMSKLSCEGKAVHLGCEMRPWTHYCCTCKKFIVKKGARPKLIGAGYSRKTSWLLKQPTGLEANTACVCRDDNKKPCQCLTGVEKKKAIAESMRKFRVRRYLQLGYLRR